MLEDLDKELALAFAYMSKSSAINKLHAAKFQRDGRALHAKLLMSIARSEAIQARRTLMYVRGKLKDAFGYFDELLAHKNQDADQKYPQLSDRLQEEGMIKASEAFEQFSKVARVQRNLLNDLLENSADQATDYYVCDICGYVAVDDPPDNCPACNAVKEKFSKQT